MNAVELRLHIKNTRWFIQQNPSEITLRRGPRQRTPSGGFKDGSEPVAAQTLRLIENGAATTPQFIQTTDGQQRSVEFWLLGMPDADIKINDWWIDEYGRELQVGDIVRANGYETRAIVTQRGKGTGV